MMASQVTVADSARTRTPAEARYLAELIQEIVELHPDLAEEALSKIKAQPTPSPDGVSLSEKETAKTGDRAAEPGKIPAKEEMTPVSSSPPVPEPERRPVTDIPWHRYDALFVVESQQERKEVEVAASQFMDGLDNGAEWVYRDRRYGTVREWDEARGFGFLVEDLTEQEIFVNRRAVKHQVEPKWRHNLRVGERVTFCKLGSKRGYWAVAVLRANERAPEEIWEEPTPSPCNPVVTPPRADSPTSGPVVSGSIHAGAHATVNLATHNYSPAPLPPAERKVSYVVTRSKAPESAELCIAAASQPPDQRYVTPIRGGVTLEQRSPGYRYYEDIGVNPYLHRGADYSAIRGPGIRRVPLATTTRMGEKLYRQVI